MQWNNNIIYILSFNMRRLGAGFRLLPPEVHLIIILLEHVAERFRYSYSVRGGNEDKCKYHLFKIFSTFPAKLLVSPLFPCLLLCSEMFEDLVLVCPHHVEGARDVLLGAGGLAGVVREPGLVLGDTSAKRLLEILSCYIMRNIYDTAPGTTRASQARCRI